MANIRSIAAAAAAAALFGVMDNMTVAYARDILL
jgi:hypothetical protein